MKQLLNVPGTAVGVRADSCCRERVPAGSPQGRRVLGAGLDGRAGSRSTPGFSGHGTTPVTP